MKKIKRLLAKISDLPNAYRVLEIMDNAGCDIEKVETYRNGCGYYRIKPKWYVTEREAKDLQKIVLFKSQYKKRNKIWYWIFNHIREDSRFLYYYKYNL